MTWKTNLEECRRLRKRGAELLHDRVKLAAAIYDDAEFRNHCNENGTNEIDFLDAEFADTACDFLTLRAVLEAYPQKVEWQRHNIRDLIAMVLDAQRKSRGEPERRLSWKDRCLAAEKEIARLTGIIEELRNTVQHFASGSRVGV